MHVSPGRAQRTDSVQQSLLLKHSPTLHLRKEQGPQEIYPPQLFDTDPPQSVDEHDVLQPTPPVTKSQTPIDPHLLDSPDPHFKRPPEGDLPKHVCRVAVHEAEHNRLRVVPSRHLTEQVTDDFTAVVAVTRMTTRKR